MAQSMFPSIVGDANGVRWSQMKKFQRPRDAPPNTISMVMTACFVHDTDRLLSVESDYAGLDAAQVEERVFLREGASMVIKAAVQGFVSMVRDQHDSGRQKCDYGACSRDEGGPGVCIRMFPRLEFLPDRIVFAAARDSNEEYAHMNQQFDLATRRFVRHHDTARQQRLDATNGFGVLLLLERHHALDPSPAVDVVLVARRADGTLATDGSMHFMNIGSLYAAVVAEEGGGRHWGVRFVRWASHGAYTYRLSHLSLATGKHPIDGSAAAGQLVRNSAPVIRFPLVRKPRRDWLDADGSPEFVPWAGSEDVAASLTSARRLIGDTTDLSACVFVPFVANPGAEAPDWDKTPVSARFLVLSATEALRAVRRRRAAVGFSDAAMPSHRLLLVVHPGTKHQGQDVYLADVYLCTAHTSATDPNEGEIFAGHRRHVYLGAARGEVARDGRIRMHGIGDGRAVSLSRGTARPRGHRTIVTQASSASSSSRSGSTPSGAEMGEFKTLPSTVDGGDVFTTSRSASSGSPLRPTILRRSSAAAGTPVPMGASLEVPLPADVALVDADDDPMMPTDEMMEDTEGPPPPAFAAAAADGMDADEEPAFGAPPPLMVPEEEARFEDF